jgi:hypothetical protein
VNRVRARFARCAQFPTRRTAPCTDLPGSECAYARRLFNGESADVGAVECSSESSVQFFQTFVAGSGAPPSTQAITVGRARGSGDLCCVKPLALGGPGANRRLPSATALTSSPLESWTRLWLADGARLVTVSRGYLVAELQSRNSTTSSLEQAGETSGCPQRRGSADSKHRRSRHRRRLKSCEPSTVRGACEVVPVAHGRMLSDDFGRRRSAKDSGARSNLGSRIGWLANSISVSGRD